MTAVNSKKELFDMLALSDDASLGSSALMYEYGCHNKSLKSLHLGWFDEVVIYKNIRRLYVNKKLSAYDDINALWDLINSCFSEGIIKEACPVAASLGTTLEEFKNAFEQFTDPDPVVNYFRIEENKGDYRVCLSVDPLSGIVRLSYSDPAEKGIKSAFSEFMHMKFNMFDIHETLESDSLDFIMRRTYKMHPQVMNNFQLFSFIFGNKIKKQRVLDSVRAAADRQRSFIEELIPFCQMIYGPDIESNDIKGLEADLQVVDGYDMKYYIGGREYAHPDFSLKIKYSIVEEGSASNKEDLSFRLMIIYYPLEKGVIQSDTWSYHDIILDFKK